MYVSYLFYTYRYIDIYIYTERTNEIYHMCYGHKQNSIRTTVCYFADDPQVIETVLCPYEKSLSLYLYIYTYIYIYHKTLS